MKKLLPFALAAAFCAAPVFGQETATSDPVGYTTTVCLANSDTVLSTPLAQSSVSIGSLTATPTDGTFDVSTDPALPSTGEFYLKLTSGDRSGDFFTVVSATSTSITVDLNGGGVADILSENTYEIVPFWTLDTLFPPATQTAIIESLGSLAFQRRTEILLPDVMTDGINLAPSRTFFLTSTGWQESGGSGDGSTTISPDSYFIVRHPATLPNDAASTSYVNSGAVVLGDLAIALSTRTDGPQDNFVAVPRPINVTLSDLNLFESGAFVASLGTLSFQRRDELLVFANASTGLNKAPIATYFHNGTNWVQAGVTGNADDTEIAFNEGFIIRKFQTVDGATSMWQNTPNYSLAAE